MKIGILGLGAFAKFLAETFIRQGHTLCATSLSEEVLLLNDVTALIDAGNDVVLISTPIRFLSEVLGSMPLDRLKSPVLFVDVLSVKEYPRQALLDALPEESDILCTHPMFGPQGAKDGWRGHNFMYEKVRIRNEDTCSNFLKIFESEGCTMQEMPCREHDELAAKTQFITHTVGWTLKVLGITSTRIDTKSFQTLLQTETVSRDSPDLFYGLFTHNRFALKELENLVDALRKVKEMLIQKNEEEEKSKVKETLIQKENEEKEKSQR